MWRQWIVMAITCTSVLADSDSYKYDLVAASKLNFVHKNSTGQMKLLGTTLRERRKENDVCYVLLGHPFSRRAIKRHMDTYAGLFSLLTATKLPNKGSLLNADLPPEDEIEQGGHQSYFGDPSEMLRDYAKTQLKIGMDQPENPYSYDFDYLGIVGHTWQDCIDPIERDQDRVCIRIIQIRNYDQLYPSQVNHAHLAPVVRWAQAVSRRHRDELQLYVFQQFDAGTRPILKLFAGEHGALRPTPRQRIIGLVFSLSVTRPADAGRAVCVHDGRRIPVLYTADLGEDSYLIMQIAAHNKTVPLRYVYKVDTRPIGEQVDVSDVKISGWDCQR